MSGERALYGLARVEQLAHDLAGLLCRSVPRRLGGLFGREDGGSLARVDRLYVPRFWLMRRLAALGDVDDALDLGARDRLAALRTLKYLVAGLGWRGRRGEHVETADRQFQI